MGYMIPAGDNGDDCNLGRGWRKSSYSMSNGHCLETACLPGGHIGVRDSQDTEGPALRFKPAAWATFLTRLRTSPSSKR
ncbi:MAG: DUF397 domain-containing protein [Streptosporangiaceae bacterium]